MESSSKSFWIKVVDAELFAEEELSDLLLEMLPPDELEVFIIEHYSELGDCLMTSPIFRNAAKLDDKVYKTLRETKRQWWLVQETGSREQISMAFVKREASQAGCLGFLKLDQLTCLPILQGRLDKATTLKEHFSFVEPQERAFFVKAVPGLKALLEAL